MKHYLKLISILFICSLSFGAVAQTSKLYLESNKKYSSAKIYIKKSFDPIIATKVILVNDSVLNYVDENTGLEKSLNINSSSINYLKIKTGTRVGELALYGGGFMCLCALYGVSSAESNYGGAYGDYSGVNWFPFIGGFTAVGAVVGAVIGVFSPKYKNFYLKDNSTSYKFEVSPYYYKEGGIGMAMRVTF